MVFFGVKNTWGNIPDLAGAENKLQLGEKDIEKNSDPALGFEEKSEFSNEASGSWPSAADGKTLFNPGELKSSEQESETEKSLEQTKTPGHLPAAEGIESLETDKAVQTETGKAIRTEAEETTAEDENNVHEVEEHGDHKESTDGTATLKFDQDKSELPLPLVPVELSECIVQNVESPVSINEPQESETSEVKSPTSPDILQQTPVNFQEDQAAGSTFKPGESDGLNEVRENFLEKIKEESREEERFEAKEGVERVSLVQPEASSDSKEGDDTSPVACEEINSVGQSSSIPSSSEVAPALVLHEIEAKANQNEGEHLSNDAGSDMKEQHLSYVSNMLDSDSVVELERVKREMKTMETALQGAARQAQVEENKVESIKRDKKATESLLQETIEKHQAELAAQKDYYTNALAALIALVALIAAKKAEALAEARVNNEARIELESRQREAEERESMLVQAHEELRRRLRQRELEILLFQFVQYWNIRSAEMRERCYRASVIRFEQQLAQVPQLTRPLSRQIEDLQETNARRAEVWATVERTLNFRVQEAEAEAAAAKERERSMNERLSQNLSQIKVLEAQISRLRTEQVQISRSLEKERQIAAENRQECLAAKEEADTQEGRVRQLEEEIRELRQKNEQELQELSVHQELLQQEIEREKAARADIERIARVNSAPSSDQTPAMKKTYAFENGNLTQKTSNAISLGSMDESCFLQASLESSDSLSERRDAGEHNLSPYCMRSMTTKTFEAALRQKEGELASYKSRLASVESIRDSFAEELVNMIEECEKLRGEAAALPGLRAEVEALRKRHSAALELMGERDEELEELRADMANLKEVYKEQVNLLVNKIQMMKSSPDVG